MGRNFCKSLTSKQKQWIWFLALWFGGLSLTMLLSFVIRMVMGIG